MSKYAWRAVVGRVEALWGRELEAQSLENLLEDLRVVSRGKLLSPYCYALEVVVVGRRRRVAVLREDGTVGPGLQLPELVDKLARAGLGVRATVLDAESFGDPDFGDFDVELSAEDYTAVAPEEAIAPMPIPPQFALSHPAEEETAGKRLKSRYVHPVFTGPYLYVSDAALASAPAEAALGKQTIAVLDLGKVRAFISRRPFKMSWSKFDGQTFYIRLAGIEEGNPELIICDGERVRRMWSWLDELPDTNFTASNTRTAEFAAEHMGAHAMAHALADIVPGTNATEIHAAIICGPGVGPGLLLQALGLPTDVLAALVGLEDLEEIPEAHIFDQDGLAKVLRHSFRLKVAGHGGDRRFWDLYRRIGVDNPWVIRSVGVLELLGAGALGWNTIRLGRLSKAGTRHKLAKQVCSVLAGVLLLEAVLGRGWNYFVRHELAKARSQGYEVPKID